MFRKGARVKNVHTGKCMVIVETKEVSVPPLLVFISDDGTRYNLESLKQWRLDEQSTGEQA